tara:strand:+ start:34 stop:534 length:501 start_codon:yes stop_codon:yes gene_type:complete
MQMAGIELGDATDTTIARVSAGKLSVEGNLVPAVASLATGDILYASSSTAYARLAAGTDTHVLTLAAGIPSWAAAGGVAAATSSTGFAVGASVFLEFTSGSSIAAGDSTTSVVHATIKSASFTTLPGTGGFGEGGAPGGTWRNDSGASMDADASNRVSMGTFTRTA